MAKTFLTNLTLLAIVCFLFYIRTISAENVDQRLKKVQTFAPFNFENAIFKKEQVVDGNSKKAPNSTCLQDLGIVLASLVKEPTGWAGQMLDAAGKVPSGIFRGNTKWTGNYRQCLSVSVPANDSIGFQGFGGKYCWATITVQPLLKIYSGFCVPSSCSDEDFDYYKEELYELLEKFIPAAKNYTQLVSVSCPVQDTTLSGSAIAFIVALSAIVIFAVIGTSLDIQKKIVKIIVPKKSNTIQENAEPSQISEGFSNSIKRSNSQVSPVALIFNEHGEQPQECKEITQKAFLERFLLCFSLYTNGAKLLQTEGTQAQLGCLHGIRFISMTWVILGHTYASAVSAIDNPLDMIEDIRGWAFQAVMAGPYSVDTFFTLSGLLMCYLFMKEYKKRDGVMTWKNWVYFYVHRIWRLSAMYFLLLWFWVSVYDYLGSGPLWNGSGDEKGCSESVWMNILYINNFASAKDMCMGWTWYLANDMQFYIISPLFLIPLYFYPAIGYAVVSFLMLASWISTGVINTHGGYKGMFQGLDGAVDQPATAQNDQMNFMVDIYVKPYTRIGPYLVGVLTGYLLYLVDKKKEFLTWWLALLGWLVAAYLGLALVYGTFQVNMSLSAWSFHTALSRSAWGVAVCWVIFACITGYGGWINTLLSHPAWIPLSRLTYSAYLIHLMLLSWFLGTLQDTMHATHVIVVVSFLGLLVITYGLSFLISALLEASARNLEGLIMEKQK